MKIDIEVIKAKASKEDDGEDTVDYDLVVQLAEKWIEDHPSEKPPRNDIADKLEELVAASDGAGMVRDAVIDALVARWPTLKTTSLKSEWREGVEAYQHGDGAGSYAEPQRRPLVEYLEPWETAVNVLLLAEDVRHQLTRHVAFDNPDTDPDAVVLWVLATYHMDAWFSFPKLIVTSPTKRCGKTTLLSSVRLVAPRAFMTSDPTKATFFRIIDQEQPTFILDEADEFIASGHEITGIINASHTRDSAVIPRVEEIDGQREVVGFEVWCGQVFGGIGRKWISDTLSDRSVILPLTRKKTSRRLHKLTALSFGETVDLRRKLLRWSNDNQLSILNAARDNPDPLFGRGDNDRAQDNWAALYHIAAHIGGDWPNRVQHAFDRFAQTGDSVEDEAIQLLADIETILADKPNGFAQSAALAKELNADETLPWGSYREGQGISTHTIAAMLRPFGLGPVKRRRDTSRAANPVRGYDLKDVTGALDPYRPEKVQKT